MKLSIVGLLAAISVSEAVHVPFFDSAAAAARQQVKLGFDFDRVTEGYQNLIDKIDSSTSSVVETIAKYMEEPMSGVTSDTKKLWSEMMLQFPEAVAKLNFKSLPKKSTPQQFDFHVTDAKVPNHRLRVKSTPEDLGVDTVKQYTGYLDVDDEDKHFFYWFFESRNDPKNDPVILWLNGGPGCSSLTGLFFELGSSSVGPGLKPIYNPHSWNSNASVIFLDQPVNVGYSYSSALVSDTIAAGKDVYAFLELFYKQFPDYLNLPFHIAGESYAGHYIPAFASEILSHEDRSFNLTSVLIGNGLTDPLTQYEYYEPMACGQGGEPSVLEPEECEAMSNAVPRCQSLIQSCYDSSSVWLCVPATIYCNNAEMGPYQRSGRNVYDIRTMCEGGNLCYPALEDIEKYLNLDEVKKAVGAEVDTYQSCNFDVNRNFQFAGDWMKPYYKAVVDLLEADLPVLIYAGDKDFICNWLGNEAWTKRLEWSGKDKFSSAPMEPWTVGKNQVGEVRNHKHFTFLRVYGGGHMVPYDQPESSLAMVNEWIGGNYKF